MVLLRKTLYMIVALCAAMSIQAEAWRTHFAYNNVTQIALGSDVVYALSDGSLFSVNKQTEAVKVYNHQSGLHGTSITCIHYDALGSQLLIGYSNGQIDLLTSNGVRYIGDLYDKDMTQRKTIYNVTLQGRTAYLSTPYGVQTMDMREYKLVDSYWLRPGGQEIEVKDVLLTKDSIYAFTDDSLFCAKQTDNLVDYRVWKREKSGRVSPDTEKGAHYKDGSDHWYRGYEEGIIRQTATTRLTYKPQGPLTNKPYYLSVIGNEVIMLQGGRWTASHQNPGHVMRLVDGTWHNISAESIQQATGAAYVLDFMNAAVDPADANHYFVTSYGTGLYEFRGDQCVGYRLADDVIKAIIPTNPARYTRLLGAHYDSAGRLWFLDAGVDQPVYVQQGTQTVGLPLVINGVPKSYEVIGDLLIDRRNEQHKWISIAYKGSGMVLLNDGGTPMDASDDAAFFRGEWTNQNGQTFKPTSIFALCQDRQGRIWMATDQGAAYIDATTDFLQSDAIIQPDVMDTNGENPIKGVRIKAVCQDADGQIWIGSESLGVYVLNEAATEIVAHYTTDNSAMSGNGILSLSSATDGRVFIGTSEGLVEYDPHGHGEGLNGSTDEGMNGLEEGSMLNWKLHFSYVNPQEIAATPEAIYALANGSLFSVNRADESITYWNKSTGLTGTSVSHIAYDATTEQLVIAYENGQVDLLSAHGKVVQMPDIALKAGSIDVGVRDICVGSKHTYFAMSFGIVAIQTKKGEVTDTYYIGDDAAAITIQQVAEMGDSLYAFSFDKLYRGALKDNLVDYSFWQSETIPFDEVEQACVYKDQLYVLAHDSLYRRDKSAWLLVHPDPLDWIHVSDGQLLTYQRGTGMLYLADDGSMRGLTNSYIATDGVYTNGEYWLAEEERGLIRLGSSGDTRLMPDGPMTNFGYHLDIAHDRLYVSPGGRWATEYIRDGAMSIYDGHNWIAIPWQQTWAASGHAIRDVVQYAVDRSDPGHFFVATYGTGVFEFRDYMAVQHYDPSNSSLSKVNASVDEYYFTRTDGAMMDEQGNLWVLNATELGRPLHVRTPDGLWYAFRLRSNGMDLSFETPAGIWTDHRKGQWKWLMNQRGKPQPSLVLFDDGGTPTYNGDDRCIARSSFIDQDGKQVSPSFFFSFAQDQNDRIWVGTDKGIILFPKETDFFNSNACRRIIIPRNDGTGLGDYLLGDEQIKCLAVDSGNRMWIGTANSGLYLIEDDTITVAHFTETNSLLPSNSVQSIAIMPKTGEVFVGTDRGIASYRSDASEAKADMSEAYAYPNPVRPDYGGYISITGLMDNTVVNIIDAGGNLVCKTRSHGGTAVWDGKLPDGRRATPGVYTALCNAEKGHAAVKILVIR